MKLLGLDGREYSLNARKYMVDGNQTRPRSSLHLEARTLLKEMFPGDIILEEITLPGCKPTLYADFFIPLQKLIVEVQGEQHYKQNSFFHKTDDAFLKAKKRDVLKKRWCEVNDLIIIELPYDKKSEWRDRIDKRWD